MDINFIKQPDTLIGLFIKNILIKDLGTKEKFQDYSFIIELVTGHYIDFINLGETNEIGELIIIPAKIDESYKIYPITKLENKLLKSPIKNILYRFDDEPFIKFILENNVGIYIGVNEWNVNLTICQYEKNLDLSNLSIKHRLVLN